MTGRATKKTRKQKLHSLSAPMTTAAIATVGTAVVAGAPQPGAAAGLLTLFLTLFPSVIGMLVQVHFEAQKKRVESWWREFVAASGGSEEELRELLEEKANDRELAAAVTNGIRAMLDCADDATVPALGRLSYRYLGKKPDGFFRSTARLLSDLTAEEYDALVAYLEAARSGLASREEETFRLAWHWSEPEPSAYVNPMARDLPDFAPRAVGGWSRVFDLLCTHHLAEEDRETGSWSGREVMMDRETVVAITSVVLGEFPS